MENDESQKQLKEIRIQSRNQVILLIFSLILVFLWFTNFSWTLHQKTFSIDATETAGNESAKAMGEDSEMGVAAVIPITLVIAIIFTIIYIILLIAFTPCFTKNNRNRLEDNCE